MNLPGTIPSPPRRPRVVSRGALSFAAAAFTASMTCGWMVQLSRLPRSIERFPIR